jgi:phosphoglucosamine mutase
VDNKGCVVDGDAILYVMARYMKQRGLLKQNTVVTTVMSNYGLYKAFERLGINHEKTAVGDKYVYECMQRHGYRLGGEQSGHIIFSKYANTGDGIITAIQLMELLCGSGKALHELLEGYEVYPQVLENLRVKDKASALQNERVRAAVSKAEARLGDTGRMLICASGTETVIRVMAEAESMALCRACVDEVIQAMREEGLLL